MLAITLFDTKQASDFAAIAVVISLVVVAARLLSLPALKIHRPFLGVISYWALINAMPLVITSPALYSKIYMVLVPISWLMYVLVARKLYQEIFPRYPGIAFAGKWALNIAGGIALAVLVGSTLFIQARFLSSSGLTVVMVIDQCVGCGISFLLIIVVVVISRYPIEIQRNIAIHCILFSAIFFSNAIVNILDELTGFKFGARLNVVQSALSVTLCILWAVRLNKQGDNVAVKIRQKYNPALESHLLNQLDVINGILLRAARK